MSEELEYGGDAAEGQMVMPFYVICDVSGSMTPDMPLLNEGIQKLRQSIVQNPVVDDVAHISIISFSTNARVVMPLSQMSDQPMPTLVTDRGVTNYGKAFRELARAIPPDAAALRAQGYKIFRPCAFFLTDGEPSDRDWLDTFRTALTYDNSTGVGMKQYPVFIPFGFRDAQEAELRKLAYPFSRGKYYHIKTQDIEQVIDADPRHHHEDGGGERAELVWREARPGARTRPYHCRALRWANLMKTGFDVSAQSEAPPATPVPVPAPGLFAIGEPGRAAFATPDGPPPAEISPPDVAASSAALPGMRIRAASVRGIQHKAQHTARQDAFALAQRGGRQAIAVVCDGVGSLDRSDYAAAMVSQRLAELSMSGMAWRAGVRDGQRGAGQGRRRVGGTAAGRHGDNRRGAHRDPAGRVVGRRGGLGG